ncbi:MAG: SurA N-terminal domain-containing protein [Pseudomonadota bacterium]
MLRSFRNLSHMFITKVLMVMIVLSFMVWGVGDAMISSNDAARIKGADNITHQELARAIDNIKRNITATGAQFDDAMTEQIKHIALNQSSIPVST